MSDNAAALLALEPAAPAAGSLLDPTGGDAAAGPITADDATAARIAAVAAELRGRLTPLLAALAGTPARPIRLMRGIGLDKSLASRLVQATKAESDMEFLHTVPSPTGLRILLDKAGGAAGAAAGADLARETAVAVDRFEALLDALPGGRQALDARMGETSTSIRKKREHMARQASFKAVSFLFGHYCDTLVTSLFVVPSASGETYDLIEIHRRVGLERLSASTAVPLLSMHARIPDEAASEDDQPPMATLSGNTVTRRPEDFLLASASSTPLPELRVIEEGEMVTFVLDPAPQSRTPARLTSAFRVMRLGPVKQTEAFNAVRRYMLHTPCRTLVRDVFLADGLWPDAQLQVGFYLPGPTGTPSVTLEPGKPHHRQVNLTCRIEQLPSGVAAFELPGVADQRATILGALARAGLEGTSFRGWRCGMSYPVPLIEMQIAFRFRAGAV
jgi:hypothetical protein